jgi:hypothetical protein
VAPPKRQREGLGGKVVGQLLADPPPQVAHDRRVVPVKQLREADRLQQRRGDQLGVVRGKLPTIRVLSPGQSPNSPNQFPQQPPHPATPPGHPAWRQPAAGWWVGVGGDGTQAARSGRVGDTLSTWTCGAPIRRCGAGAAGRLPSGNDRCHRPVTARPGMLERPCPRPGGLWRRPGVMVGGSAAAVTCGLRGSGSGPGWSA